MFRESCRFSSDRDYEMGNPYNCDSMMCIVALKVVNKFIVQNVEKHSNVTIYEKDMSICLILSGASGKLQFY